MVSVMDHVVIPVEALDELLEALRRRGFRVLGPTLHNGAIVYDDLDSAADLPIGWTDRQDAGTYRLERREDEARFGYAVGPQSWKRFLFPSRVRLWRAKLNGGEPTIEAEQPGERPLALVGVRSCELHAIATQDRVLLGGLYADADYAARREDAFLVAVDCHEPGGTCFCTSMGTGPKVQGGHDLVLSELLDGEHRFLAASGTDRGAEVLAELSGRPPEPADLDAADASVASAAERMGRTMESFDLRDLLARNLEHPRWEEVARRCLTCGNCTMVCPTCFCTSVEDETDLAATGAERWRVWDTCFSLDYSYIHGGSIRPTGRSRYRQWMTHKLGTWHDQFGTSGCVGCGRCISWCPVGIDITEEVAAIRASDGSHATVD
jgi:sulfhydrogenase subunit beta (sulfur reductase)